ncbi:MAG TPA: sensor domain-containing diguanylate cyclase [Thermoanaerobaculia bacterium]|nr:sensor domain-containing diguanylate cyclase [Thermoanaerobaculia bacterium]
MDSGTPSGASDVGARPTGDSGIRLLAEIARAAGEDLDLRPRLQRVVDLVARTLKWDLVAVHLPDRVQNRVVAEAVASRVPTTLPPLGARSIATGAVGWVVQKGKERIVEDVASDPELLPLGRGVSSLYCLPVMHRGDVVAVLDLEDRFPHDAEGELPLLRALAELLAGVIAVGRLHGKISHRSRSLELIAELSKFALDADQLEPVLRRLAFRLRERFDLLAAAVYFVDREHNRLELEALSTRERLAGRPHGADGVVWRAVRLREPQLVPDVSKDPEARPRFPQARAALAVPILYRRRLLGVFGFENDVPEVFDDETLELLRALASQLAGLVHMATLNSQLKTTSAQLERANLQLQLMNRQLEELSTVDALTGVANRRMFDRTLELEWRRAKRTFAPVSLMLLDVDHFKKYNDTCGHPRGDEVLKEVAQLLTTAFNRAGDLVARYGGEEFVVLLPHTSFDAARTIAEQARLRIETRGIEHPASPTAKVVTVSIGVAGMQPDPWQEASVLIDAADKALYRAKAGGRNCVRAAE